MKKKIQRSLRHSWINKMVWTFAILLIGFIAVLAWKWNDIPPEIPLFYSLSRGEEQLAAPWQLAFLPGLSLVFFLADMGIAVSIFDDHKELAAICATVSAIVTLILFITFINIILLVS